MPSKALSVICKKLYISVFDDVVTLTPRNKGLWKLFPDVATRDSFAGTFFPHVFQHSDLHQAMSKEILQPLGAKFPTVKLRHLFDNDYMAKNPDVPAIVAKHDRCHVVAKESNIREHYHAEFPESIDKTKMEEISLALSKHEVISSREATEVVRAFDEAAELTSDEMAAIHEKGAVETERLLAPI